MPKYIPVVDFAKCGLLIEDDADVERAALTESGNKLYEAFTTSGFAYLSNHGIPSKEVDAFNAVMEKFFTLPEEVKRQYYLNSLKFGYDPIGTLRSNSKMEFDYNEAFRITGAAMTNDKTRWPDDPAFKKMTLRLADLHKRLSLRILRALAIGMKLKDPDFFVKCHSLVNQAGNDSTLKAVRYPPVPTDDTLKKNQSRLAAHTDWVVLAMLFQDTNGGLQVENLEGEFEDVTPIPGTMVINIADTLHFWSGGRLKSGLHRVVVPKDPAKRMNARKSIVYFLQADDDVLLDELEFEVPCGNPGKRRNSQTKTVKEYMAKRFSECFY